MTSESVETLSICSEHDDFIESQVTFPIRTEEPELIESQETLSPCSEQGEIFESEEALSEENGLNDSQETIPYSYTMPYTIGWDPRARSVSESESESESVVDMPELYSHKFIPDGDPAPFSSSFVEEEEEEEDEEELREGPALQVEDADQSKQSQVYFYDKTQFQSVYLLIMPFLLRARNYTCLSIIPS